MGNVLSIILQRLALGLLTLLIVSIVIFVAVNMLPGDFAELILGQGATPEAVKSIREDLGLDQPLVSRYFGWLGGMLTGDLGTSFSQLNFQTNLGGGAGKTVAQQIAPRFANTMFLATVTAAIVLAAILIIIAAMAAIPVAITIPQL